ncbi:O-antigen ligase family protein [Sulfurospirillum arsenophilum]|uniref:O-antigen ligase family protein n=1 Tax=Sulfurospirillum arsenophilum TaxID=56698 RepID=UPI0005A5F64F|nr:O-antigen ligase family protein [Sulfurospirillum arsenophilum]
MNKLRHFTEKYYFLFLFIYILFLPIAHTASVQAISLALFVIFFLLFEYKNLRWKAILIQKKILFIFSGFLVLALISLWFTPDVVETLKEIKKELLKNFIVMALFFYFTLRQDNISLEKILYIFFFSLTFHTLYNIYTWITHGGFPFRAGGLLDNGGGERFGIWATYALAFSIALFFTHYKKIATICFLTSLLSIVANNTRATYVAVIFMVMAFFTLFIQNKKTKFLFIGIFLIAFALFYEFSDCLSNRYNIKNTISKTQMLLELKPFEFDKFEKEYGIDYSISARLAMWKSVILYRAQEPFIPQGYGRFVYGKGIQNNFKHEPENIPFDAYAQTHNDFFGFFYGLGLFGLILFVYFLYLHLKISYFIVRNTQSTLHKTFATFTFFGVIGFIGSIMFGSFFGDSEAKLFYCLYGILLGIHYKETHENLPSTSA